MSDESLDVTKTLEDRLNRNAKLARREVVRAEKRLRRNLHDTLHIFRDLRREATLGKRLYEILEDGVSILQLSHSAENDEYSVVAYLEEDSSLANGTAKPVTVVKDDLLDAIDALCQGERSKRCRGKCKSVKLLGEFSRDAGNKVDGRCRYCKVCERFRVKEYTRKKGAA